MSVRDVFDWLAAKPKSQYTLGEMIFGKGETYSMQINRGGRMAERATTAGFIIGGAAAVLTGDMTGWGIVAMAFSKNAGMVAGAMSHVVLDGVAKIFPRKSQAQGVKL